ncbi:hypothetical protein N6H05_01780 [Sphingobium sp. WTD-1]|uniref:hypothetical protein n=1 Tax=Sphingobium sp. WTD-1 TaxID=2979467 RepID=UPI0024DE2436|nr:hypothetical protein [Sphingobium sp. WTD-1]WIA56580.1 hypothetical protein N6H05_01780 [Sphingobium sp. WTD-1]
MTNDTGETRTARALALQARGASNRQIADALGVTVSTASALLASGHRAKSRGGTGTPCERGKYGIGTAALETAIMDLWDEGKSYGQIAELLNIRRETAEKIVAYMREGATDLASGEAATARSSAALLDALRRAHPERCSA